MKITLEDFLEIRILINYHDNLPIKAVVNIGLPQ